MADHKYPGYQAWLPPRVRYDEKLSPAAKLLFCEISAMTDVRGYCWATNRYLAALLRITKVHVGRLLSDLAGRGYITSEVIRSETGEVKERRIYVSDQAMATIPPPYKNVDTPPYKNVDTPPHKNVGTPTNKNVAENDSNKEHTPYSPPKGGRARDHKKTPDYRPEAFEKLWTWYPGDPERHGKRGNRQRAIRAWDKLMPSPELIETMAEALARQARSEEWREGIGIPHLSTYLNGAGWEGWESEAS